MLFSAKVGIALALMVAVLASTAVAQSGKKPEVKPRTPVTAKKQIIDGAKMDVVDTAVTGTATSREPRAMPLCSRMGAFSSYTFVRRAALRCG